jgi:hypothetical protein
MDERIIALAMDIISQLRLVLQRNCHCAGGKTIADDDSVDGKDTKIENKKGNQRSYLLFTLEILLQLITFDATDCFFAAVALVLEFARSDGGVLF